MLPLFRLIDRMVLFLFDEETSEVYYRWRLRKELTSKTGKSRKSINSLIDAKKEAYSKAVTDLHAIALVSIDNGIDISRILPKKELAEVRSLSKLLRDDRSLQHLRSKDATQTSLIRLSEMLQVPPVSPDRTKMFKGVTHSDLCTAFQYWFSNLQLLFGEPVQILTLHGLHEEGVDLIIDLMTSQLKFGFQINSHGDVEDKGFQKKVASQISYSQKHSLSRLFVVICSDLTDPSQEKKTRTLLSNLSQMGEYALPIAPERATVIFECFHNKTHPLDFIKGAKEIAGIVEGLARALSDDTYEANVTIRYESREPPPKGDMATTHISFKSGTSAIKGLELIRQATKAGQPVTIPGEIVESIRLLDDKGRSLIPADAKPGDIRIVPEIAKLPIVNLVTGDLQTGRTVRLNDVQFVREKYDGTSLYLVSNDSPKPYQLKLVIDLSKGASQFSGHINPDLTDLKQALEFIRFMKTLSETGRLELRDKSKDNLVLNLSGAASPGLVDQRLPDLFETLTFIQEKMGVRIPVPISPTSWDLGMAKEIQMLLKNERLEMESHSFGLGLTKASATSVLKTLREGGVMSDIKLKIEDLRVKLLGQTLSLGSARIDVPLARHTEELSDLEERYQDLEEGKHMFVQFVSCGEQKPILYLDKATA